MNRKALPFVPDQSETMQFTKTAQLLMLDIVRASPPNAGEYVRMKGMGELYLTPTTSPTDDQYRELMVIRLDDVDYKLCNRISS